MSKPLAGVRVAITENRYPEQLTQLFERLGAKVFVCPLLRETPVEHVENARQFMSLCASSVVDFIVFYTGVGVEFLLREAATPEVLRKAKIIARGPKAVNALKKFGITTAIAADSPTTEGILRTLARENIAGKMVLVQLYGQENAELRSGLETLGARVNGISLYHYENASDTAAVSELIRRIIQNEIDAITFTNGPQARFLLQSAAALGCEEELRRRFRESIVVASIGEVTTRALRETGVEPHVIPEEPKMGPLVKAIAEFFQTRTRNVLPHISGS